MSCAHKVSTCILILIGPGKKKKNVKKVEKVNKKNKRRIIPKPHAHLQSMTKTPAMFQKDQYKTIRGVLL